MLFQSTLPREERPCSCDKLLSSQIFQSTLPREERHFWFRHKGYNFYISIHAPTRGATVLDEASAQLNSNFNPRSHERSDIYPINHFRWSIKYFNPRSHERSDLSHLQQGSFSLISIHAPTRGATYHICNKAHSLLFQSTLPREERQRRGALNG